MQPLLAIGLMSGTSRDGVDAALIRSDGLGHVEPLAFLHHSYDDVFRARLAEACEVALKLPAPTAHDLIEQVTRELTDRHAAIVHALIEQAGCSTGDIHAIGFHGHTIAHRPDRRWTWQIGDGQALAKATGIITVHDFRSADVAAGGQGAPLIPIYHGAMTQNLGRPVALLNLGGVANITAIGADEEMIAFDCGMANALIDDWVQQHFGMAYDKDGRIAASGVIDEATLTQMLAHPFFDAPAPKSLDRADFSTAQVAHLAPADGAATLTAFTAMGVARGCALLPQCPKQILVAGGGRLNPVLMEMVGHFCGAEVHAVDSFGWNGDATEAEGFAYMALRRLADLPISFPGTTGAPVPMTGGVICRP